VVVQDSSGILSDMTTSDIPIACTLTDADFRARRDGILAALRRERLEERPIPDGIALRFAPAPGQVTRLLEVIELERQCCRFLQMRLTVAPGEGPIWLELSGPPGTVEFLSDELGLGSVQRQG
jgi:hypothetical protein